MGLDLERKSLCSSTFLSGRGLMHIVLKCIRTLYQRRRRRFQLQLYVVEFQSRDFTVIDVCETTLLLYSMYIHAFYRVCCSSKYGHCTHRNLIRKRSHYASIVQCKHNLSKLQAAYMLRNLSIQPDCVDWLLLCELGGRSMTRLSAQLGN